MRVSRRGGRARRRDHRESASSTPSTAAKADAVKASAAIDDDRKSAGEGPPAAIQSAAAWPIAIIVRSSCSSGLGRGSCRNGRSSAPKAGRSRSSTGSTRSSNSFEKSRFSSGSSPSVMFTRALATAIEWPLDLIAGHLDLGLQGPRPAAASLGHGGRPRRRLRLVAEGLEARLAGRAAASPMWRCSASGSSP